MMADAFSLDSHVTSVNASVCKTGRQG